MVGKKGGKGGDFVDKIVAWGCSILHLSKYEKIFQQLAKFVIVGVITTAINWIIYALALAALPVGEEVVKVAIASAIAFVISTIFSFWGNTKWVFETTNKKTRRRLFAEFAIFNTISFLVFDEAMLTALVSGGWHPMISKILTTVCGMIFNFITRKIFLEDHDQPKVDSRRSSRASSKKSSQKQRKH